MKGNYDSDKKKELSNRLVVYQLNSPFPRIPVLVYLLLYRTIRMGLQVFSMFHNIAIMLKFDKFPVPPLIIASLQPAVSIIGTAMPIINTHEEYTLAIHV